MRPERRFLVLALLLLTSACGGRGLPFDLEPKDRPDAGPRDATPTQPDATVATDGAVGPADAGSTGPACGNGVCERGEDFRSCPADCRRPGGDCPVGAEGCACNSSWPMNASGFVRQDDCDDELLCVPWDILAGREFEVTGPVQSCVRPCRTDDECGAGRRCADSIPYADQGVTQICVDRIAAADEACGGALTGGSRLPGTQIYTAGEIVGCPAQATCIIGALQDFHPDEGVCLQRCGRSGDAPCSGTTPFCNPNVLADGVGVCSVGQLGGGSWCQIEEDFKFGYTTRCDQSGQTPGQIACVGLGLERGLCFELCDTNQPCLGDDGPGRPYTCATEILQGGGGLCMSSNCSTFPDTCDQPGLDGVGRVCVQLTKDDGLCVDRVGPPLRPALLDSTGMFIAQGDDCQGDIEFLRCPEGTFCTPAQGGAFCVAGCDPLAMGNVCEPLLMSLGAPSMNATCADVFGQPGTGVCGGD